MHSMASASVSLPEDFKNNIVDFFYSNAISNSELKPFFKKVTLNQLREEFDCLANMEKSEIQQYSDTVMSLHHWRLMEKGIQMDLVVNLWQLAYESRWIEEDNDDLSYQDPIQFLVGPSRAIYNLRAMQKLFAANTNHNATTKRGGGANKRRKKLTKRGHM
jgi:hypothetical protein